MTQKLFPNAKHGLSKYKKEIASELGIQLSDYNGNLTSKQTGDLIKGMVRKFEEKL